MLTSLCICLSGLEHFRRLVSRLFISAFRDSNISEDSHCVLVNTFGDPETSMTHTVSPFASGFRNSDILEVLPRATLHLPSETRTFSRTHIVSLYLHSGTRKLRGPTPSLCMHLQGLWHSGGFASRHFTSAFRTRTLPRPLIVPQYLLFTTIVTLRGKTFHQGKWSWKGREDRNLGGNIPGSRWSMHSYIQTYSGFKRENVLAALRYTISSCGLTLCVCNTTPREKVTGDILWKTRISLFTAITWRIHSSDIYRPEVTLQLKCEDYKL